MSHVTAIEGTNITSLQVIKNLCKTKNWNFRENQKQYAWFGRSVGDYPVPKGVKVSDLGKCDHAINIPGANYEVGILEKDGEYTFVYDFYDRKLKDAICGISAKGEEPEELLQGCAVEKAKIQAKAAGFRVKTTSVDKQLNVKLQLVHA